MTISEPPVPVDPAGENAVDELVDYFNARDFESVGALLDPDVSSAWLEVSGRDGMVVALTEVALRNPGLVLTRGELGDEPVAVAWVPGEEHGYQRMGYLTFSYSDGDADAPIEHIDYDDSAPPAELLAEEPDPDDMAEGTEWREWEAGEE
jgi:hypothetical protein